MAEGERMRRARERIKKINPTHKVKMLPKIHYCLNVYELNPKHTEINRKPPTDFNGLWAILNKRRYQGSVVL